MIYQMIISFEQEGKSLRVHLANLRKAGFKIDEKKAAFAAIQTIATSIIETESDLKDIELAGKIQALIQELIGKHEIVMLNGEKIG